MKILPQSFSFISFAAFLDFHAEEMGDIENFLFSSVCVYLVVWMDIFPPPPI